MAHSQIVDEENGLQMWRVTVNIMSKQLQTANKGWSSSFRVYVVLETSHHKKLVCYEMLHRDSDLGGFFTITSSNGQ
jgi:hypothetical protein